MKIIYFLILFTIFNGNIYSQACCTAGTPLLGSLDMSTTQKGVWRLGMTYEYNTLTDVYTGFSFLDDNLRERSTQSLLFEINYGLTDRFTITGLFSYINQNRNISPLTGISTELTNRGIGDALILLKYNVIPLNFIDQVEFVIGVGIKAPLGSADAVSNGILLPADMQRGSGSWDGILWAYFSKGFMPSLPITFLSNLSYRLNGGNNRFGNNDEGYKFGNELIASVGVGYRTDTILDFSVFLGIEIPPQISLSMLTFQTPAVIGFIWFRELI